MPNLKFIHYIADTLDMNREVALWTEWAWSEGWLNQDRQSVDSLVFTMAQTFKKRYPRHFGSFEKACEALETQIRGSLQKLTYGAQTPQQMHPQRKAYLDSLYRGPLCDK